MSTIITTTTTQRIKSAGAGLLLALIPLTAVAATTVGGSGPAAIEAAAGAESDARIASGETLETTRDQCGRDFVIIQDTSTSPGKMLSVAKGDNVTFKPISRRFSWFCADKKAGQTGESTKEWTTCASGTDRVRIVRAATGREIRWTCMD